MHLRTIWMCLANQEFRLLTAILTALYNADLLLPESAYATSTIAIQQLQKYNKELWLALNNVSPELKNRFYEKNIMLIEDNSRVVDVVNTFQGTESIISQGFFVVNQPYPEQPLPDIGKEARFIFDNSMNNILVNSENLTEIVYNEVQKVFKAEKKDEIWVLYTGLFFIILFIVFSLKYVVNINKEYFRFMNMFFTIRLEDIAKVTLTLTTFDELLVKDYENIQDFDALDPDKINKKADRKHAKDKIDKGGHHPPVKSRTVLESQMTKVYYKNLLLFSQIIIALALIIGLLILYYTEAQDKISLMEKQQGTIDFALNSVEQQTLFSVQIQSMALDNDTTTIRNRPIMQDLEENIDRLNDVTYLQKMLKNHKGKFSNLNKQVLFDIDCQDVYSPLYFLTPEILRRECSANSDGLYRIALVKLFPDLAQLIRSFILKFQTTKRDEDAVIELYLYGMNLFVEKIDLSVVLLFLSYSSTYQEFNALVDEQAIRGGMMAWWAVVALIIITYFSWRLVVSKLVRTELERKELLGLVPTGLIIKNVYLKKYLIKAFKSQGGTIKDLEI